MCFSVIVPVYNVAEYIGNTLNSIFAAIDGCGCDVEVICVDDGSSDGSGAKLDSFSGITVIHQKNGGVGSARNAALNVATGDYVCFVDGDDGVMPDYFKILSGITSRETVDIVLFDYVNVESQGGVVRVPDSYSLQTFDLTTVSGAVEGFRRFVGNGLAWNSCYRRSALKGLRFLPIPNGEDVLFAAMAFFRVDSICVCNAKIYRYTYRAGSAVNTMTARHLLSKCTMCENLNSALANWRWRHSVVKLLAGKYRTHFEGEIASNVRLLGANERAVVWKSFFRALRACAWNEVVAWIARSESRIGVYAVMLPEFYLRRTLSKWRNKLK